MAKRVLGAVMLCLTGAAVALGLLTLGQGWLAAASGLDRGVQGWVHAWAFPGLRELMLALTELGKIDTFMPAVAFVLVGMVVRGDKRRAWALGFAMVGAMALNEGLKLHFHRARPQVAWALGDERTYSFPSGHALFATVLYGTLTWLAWRAAAGGRRVGMVAIAAGMAAGVGVSRIYLGEHWPTDVMAGYSAGVVWVMTVVGVERVLSGRSVFGRVRTSNGQGS